MLLDILGYIGIAACIVWLLIFLRKKPKKSIVIGVLAALVIFILDVALPFDAQIFGNSTSSGSSSGFVLTEPSADPGGKAFSKEFIGGFYTPGIDFPAGSYTLTILQGSGTVFYTNPSGAGKTYAVSAEKSELPQKIDLPIGEVLSVSGVKFRMESSNADSAELSDRDNPATEEVTLTPGSYYVGQHFAEGIYDVVAIKGQGKVSTDCVGSSIDQVLNAAGKDYEKEIKNVILDDATVLSVSGATIKLIPSD